MPRYPHSLALGLARLPSGATAADRGETRITLALLAARHGYALVETVEVKAEGAADAPDASGGGMRCAEGDLDVALARVERLAVRLDADALVVAGGLDDQERERVEELAARVRLVVLGGPGGRW